MDFFFDALMDALMDSLRMVPLLFILYVIIEVIELKFGNKLGRAVARAGAAGPLVGACAGIIPQCGFSVMGTALYAQRLVTIGTLMAVYLSTSDEAIPVILSQPESAPLLIPILITKFVVAVVVGYAIDLIFRKRNAATLAHVQAYELGNDESSHYHEGAFEEKGCCGHTPTSEKQKITARDVLLHPLEHTAKIFAFIFIITLALNLVIAGVGEEAFADALAQQTILQPFVAAAVGLIPNCAASVVVTELYIDGAITFSAVIAGLCASGGLGILVLFKEDSSKLDACKVVGGLFAISVIAGFVAGLFA